MKKLIVVVVAVALQACNTVASVDSQDHAMHEATPVSNEGLIDTPLLNDDDKRINDMLNYQIRLPAKNRIAIIKLSKDNNWRFYSNDFNELNDSLVNSLITKLRSSPRLYDASFLPAMLVSEKRTIPVLREAAARFQADLLLAYRSSCQSYEKYRLFNASENKSYCTVEAALLDTRSGVVVKSIVSTEDVYAQKSANDVNFNETVKKAELEAVAKGLGNVANEVVVFLNSVPTIGKP